MDVKLGLSQRTFNVNCKPLRTDVLDIYIKNMVAKDYFQQRSMESNRTRRYKCRNKKKKI